MYAVIFPVFTGKGEGCCLFLHLSSHFPILCSLNQQSFSRTVCKHHLYYFSPNSLANSSPSSLLYLPVSDHAEPIPLKILSLLCGIILSIFFVFSSILSNVHSAFLHFLLFTLLYCLQLNN